MNSSRLRISSALTAGTECVAGFNVRGPLRVGLGRLLLILFLINRFPVRLKHVRWSDLSWSWEGHISTGRVSVPLNEAKFTTKCSPLNPHTSQSNSSLSVQTNSCAGFKKKSYLLYYTYVPHTFFQVNTHTHKGSRKCWLQVLWKSWHYFYYTCVFIIIRIVV